MRVALVSGYDWSVPGGVQNQVAGLARALSRSGEEVCVVAPRRDRSAGPAVDGFQLLAAGRGIAIPVNGSVAPVAPTPQAALAAVRGLQAFRPDVVHVHEPLVPGPPLAAVLAGPRPIVATFHRADPDRAYLFEGLALGRLVMRRVAAATAVSGAAADTARAVLGRSLGGVTHVPNGIDLDRFERARDALRPAVSSAWKTGDRPLVAFVGRHEERKGVALLIRALSQLREDVRVVISGAGPETAALKRDAAGDERVEFVGQLDDDGVAVLMASADVVVAPATGGESFGVVLLEAMAAGAVVVCSDIPGYVLAAGSAARLFASGDARDLARVLSDVLRDEQLRQRLLRAGAERARACAIGTVTEAYVAVYRSAIATADRS